MIDALIAGRIYGTPTQRTGHSGKSFVTAQVRTASGNGESLFVSVIAFDKQPCAALLAMADGDSVALSGALTPKVWTSKSGETKPALDMVAHGALSAYHVTRKRQAIKKPASKSAPTQAAFKAAAKAQAIDGQLHDDLPWD